MKVIPSRPTRMLLPLLAILSLLALVHAAMAQHGRPAVESQAVAISYKEAREHLIGDHAVLRTDLPPRQAAVLAMEGIQFRLTVDPYGIVRKAELQGREGGLQERLVRAQIDPRTFEGLATEAEALIQRQQFRPFTRKGQPVWAIFDDAVFVLPPERRPTRHVPFPNVRDWKSVRVTLSRSTCFGTCPSYQVEIHGDGTVMYEGKEYVAVRGRHSAKVSHEDVVELVRAFRDADYFSLDDKYVWGVTDMPTFETSITIGTDTKKVTDYVGLQAGMPASAEALEDDIDRVADTARWVKGSKGTVSALTAEGFDFKSQEATKTLLAVAQAGDTDAVRELLAVGTPIVGGEVKAESVLMAAASHGNVEMLRLLLGAGAGAHDQRSKDIALMGAAYSGRPDAVELMLKEGADATWRDENGRNALFSAVNTRNYEAEQEDVDHAAVVRLLIGAGADPNTTDKDGFGPLMEAAWDASVARALIEHGANVNARSKKGGYTPLINAVGPEVVRLLLASGGDPRVVDDKGEDALTSAKRMGNKEKEAIIRTWLSKEP